MNAKYFRLIVAFFLFFAISNRAFGQSTEETDPNIPIVSIIDWYPFGWIDENGTPQGLSVDITRHTFDAIGVEVIIEIDPVPRILRDVRYGNVNFTIVYNDPVMMKDIDFTGIVGCLYASMVPIKGSGIQSLDDVPNKRIGLANAGYFDVKFTPLYDFEHVEIVENHQLFRLAPRDRIDAIIINDAVWDAYRHRDQTTQEFGAEVWDAFGEPIIIEPIVTSFAVSPDPRFLDIAKAVGEYSQKAYQNGTYAEMFRKYGIKSEGLCPAERDN